MKSASIRLGRNARLAELRRRIDRIERGPVGGRQPAGSSVPALDRPPIRRAGGDRTVIDPFLAGGGAITPALHELVADHYGSQPSARDFGLALAASLIRRQEEAETMVLWCQRQKDDAEFGHPYAPGLRAIGLPPDRLLVVTGRNDADCLWAMEQGLASRSLLAVIGMVDRAGLTASRRLSLAASTHRTYCLLLPLQHGREPSAARVRWRVGAMASVSDSLDPEGLGKSCWRLVLERAQHGRTGHWTVEWDHATHHFHLAAPMADRPMAERHGQGKGDAEVITFDRAG